jgi:hypothetical protein
MPHKTGLEDIETLGFSPMQFGLQVVRPKRYF